MGCLRGFKAVLNLYILNCTTFTRIFEKFLQFFHSNYLVRNLYHIFLDISLICVNLRVVVDVKKSFRTTVVVLTLGQVEPSGASHIFWPVGSTFDTIYSMLLLLNE